MTTWAITNAGAAAINFRGNPNVTITAIDTSGGIACSRTSGKTPCFIQVSASAITATGTSVPYEDLSYFWNFGDPSGTETFTNPATSQSVNANNGQTGPEAAYCYRSAGTYTITLTIIGKNGSSYVSATKTQSITVTAFSPANTWYYDSNVVGGLGDGSSAANAFTTISAANLNTKINGATGDTLIKMAYGSHWSGTDFVKIASNSQLGAIRFQPYTPPEGGTANPIIEVVNDTSPAGNSIFYIQNSSGFSVGDIVASNLDMRLTGSGFTASSLVSVQNLFPARTLSNIYFDNCSISTQVSSTLNLSNYVVAQYASQGTLGDSNFNGFGWWGGSINSLTGDLARIPGTGAAFGGGAWNWTFIMGLTNVNGSGGSSYNALAHQFYIQVGNHCLVRWVNFGSGAENATRDFCVKIDCYPPPVANISAFSSGAGGVVRCTVADNTIFTNGANIYIATVTGTGAADVTGSGCDTGTGVWVGNVIGDGVSIDLVGTTYNAGHSYTGSPQLRPCYAANYFLVDGCNVTGTRGSFDANNGYGNAFASSQSNYVIQNNSVHDQPNTGLLLMPTGIDATYRDNRHWNNALQQVVPTQGKPAYTAAIYRIYRNKFYVPATPNGAGVSGDSINYFNVNGTATWVGPLTITDNIIVDMRTAAGSIGLDSYVADAAWVIDRNQYYSPNATASKFFYNGATATTLATWKAAGFDANPNLLYPSDANYGDPGWTVPPTQWSDFGT